MQMHLNGPPTMINDQKNGGVCKSSIKQSDLLNSLIKAKNDPLEQEQRLLMQEIHPQYLNELARYKERTECELQRIETNEKHEIDRIEAAHNQEMDKLQKEYDNRISDLVDTLLQELEEQRKQFDGESSALEITRWDGGFGGGSTNWNHQNAFNTQWSNAQGGHGQPGKKQLRRRPNEILNTNISATTAGNASVESNTVGGPAEKKSRKRSPGPSQTCPLITQTLLTNQAINEDIEKLFPANSVWQRISGHSAGNYSDPNTNGQNSGISEHYYRSEHRPIDGGVMADDGEQQQPGKRPRRVILEHGKLTYDGKTFQRLHNVFIKSANTSWKPLQARVIQIYELTIQFRSTIPGDTRTVTATKEDLESGRVLVWKRY